MSGCGKHRDDVTSHSSQLGSRYEPLPTCTLMTFGAMMIGVGVSAPSSAVTANGGIAARPAALDVIRAAPQTKRQVMLLADIAKVSTPVPRRWRPRDVQWPCRDRGWCGTGGSGKACPTTQPFSGWAAGSPVSHDLQAAKDSWSRISSGRRNRWAMFVIAWKRAVAAGPYAIPLARRSMLRRHQGYES